MKKEQKLVLSKWLKSQSHFGKKWLYLTIGMSFLSGLFLVIQTATLAHILHALIIEKTDKQALLLPFLLLTTSVFLKAICHYNKEKYAYLAGEKVRVKIRGLLLNKLQQMGLATIQSKPASVWATLLLEQVENLQDFFSRYLPQLAIAVMIPIIILVAVFPMNWAAGFIFLSTAPFIPFFMILVGKGAADANRRNLQALHRLSGHFYDRLRGLTTIKLFNQTERESQNLAKASDDFRKRTMEVLRLAFLSSAVLEFFTALSIALTAVYFGFSFIGELNFGHYGIKITLFTGLFILLLAPEFYQPLRELGSYYHAKSEALAAAESILEFLDTPKDKEDNPKTAKSILGDISIQATRLVVLSPDGKPLTAPLTFSIQAGEKVAILGHSGSGKTSLLNALLGFLPFEGSLKIAGIELNSLSLCDWRSKISWVGQNPELFHGSIRDNICLSAPDTTEKELIKVATSAHAYEFISRLDLGFDYALGDRAQGLSVGQAQRIALARALLQNGECWLLDEPTASLDRHSEKLIMASLNKATQNKTTLWVTHRLDSLAQYSQIFILKEGEMIHQGSFDKLKQKKAFEKLEQINYA